MLESWANMTALFLSIALILAQNQAPKNDPNGTWEAETGTKYEIQASGADLRVQLVEGSNPSFVKYEVSLKNAGEVNTYKGAGFFVVKMKNGKECRFDTDWQIVVVQKETIIGYTSTVVPDPDTCEIKDRGSAMIVLKKK